MSYYLDEFDHIDFMKNVKNALVLAKDQAGCRLLQKWLDQKDPYVTTLIYDQILPHFSDLIIDPFGNYLCQKLAESCSYHQFTQLLKSISTLESRIGRLWILNMLTIIICIFSISKILIIRC